jgi:TusA-related sulfurtransferase
MAVEKTQKLSIKNMVCPRCIIIVRETLEKLGFQVIEVELGSARVKPDASISMEKINER